MCRQMKATAQLTKELLQLAQQKGLFTDPAQQIAELAPTIRANIKAMESQLASFASAIGQYSLSVRCAGTASLVPMRTRRLKPTPRFAAKRAWTLEWRVGNHEGPGPCKCHRPQERPQGALRGAGRSGYQTGQALCWAVGIVGCHEVASLCCSSCATWPQLGRPAHSAAVSALHSSCTCSAQLQHACWCLAAAPWPHLS